MHRGYQQTGISRLSVDDIFRSIEPGNASLQAFALVGIAKLHDSAYIVRLSQVLRRKINVIYRTKKKRVELQSRDS